MVWNTLACSSTSLVTNNVGASSTKTLAYKRHLQGIISNSRESFPQGQTVCNRTSDSLRLYLA